MSVSHPLSEIARAVGAEVRGGSLQECVWAVGTDTRTLSQGSLFVALRGPRFDGHRFVPEAINKGALAVVVDREGDASLPDPPALAVPRLVVEDTLRALGDMAASARRRDEKRKVAAVTGSNGKTTTKEMLAAVLSTQGPVHKTAGNLNNLVGLPLTVLSWPAAAPVAVLEMGMSEPGEIARLTEIAGPDVGVVTNVAAAHLEGLGDLKGVAHAKGELYAGLGAAAVAVLNADDATVMEVCAPLLGARRTLRFGTREGCEVRVLEVEPRAEGLHCTLSLLGAPTCVALPLHGRHNAMNAAAAAAVALALGTPAEAIAAGFADLHLPKGRLRVCPGSEKSGGVGLVDDTYNANPASMRAAFSALADVAGTARRVAVLGDMLELGATSEALHHDVGRAAAESGIAWVLALGEHAEHIAAGARAGGASVAQAYGDIESLLRDLSRDLSAGDWVVVKGSRGMRMERVVATIGGEEGR